MFIYIIFIGLIYALSPSNQLKKLEDLSEGFYSNEGVILIQSDHVFDSQIPVRFWDKEQMEPSQIGTQLWQVNNSHLYTLPGYPEYTIKKIFKREGQDTLLKEFNKSRDLKGVRGVSQWVGLYQDNENYYVITTCYEKSCSSVLKEKNKKIMKRGIQKVWDSEKERIISLIGQVIMMCQDLSSRDYSYEDIESQHISIDKKNNSIVLTDLESIAPKKVSGRSDRGDYHIVNKILCEIVYGKSSYVSIVEEGSQQSVQHIATQNKVLKDMLERVKKTGNHKHESGIPELDSFWLEVQKKAVSLEKVTEAFKTSFPDIWKKLKEENSIHTSESSNISLVFKKKQSVEDSDEDSGIASYSASSSSDSDSEQESKSFSRNREKVKKRRNISVLQSTVHIPSNKQGSTDVQPELNPLESNKESQESSDDKRIYEKNVFEQFSAIRRKGLQKSWSQEGEKLISIIGQIIFRLEEGKLSENISSSDIEISPSKGDISLTKLGLEKMKRPKEGKSQYHLINRMLCELVYGKESYVILVDSDPYQEGLKRFSSQNKAFKSFMERVKQTGEYRHESGIVELDEFWSKIQGERVSLDEVRESFKEVFPTVWSNLEEKALFELDFDKLDFEEEEKVLYVKQGSDSSLSEDVQMRVNKIEGTAKFYETIESREGSYIEVQRVDGQDIFKKMKNGILLLKEGEEAILFYIDILIQSLENRVFPKESLIYSRIVEEGSSLNQSREQYIHYGDWRLLEDPINLLRSLLNHLENHTYLEESNGATRSISHYESKINFSKHIEYLKKAIKEEELKVTHENSLENSERVNSHLYFVKKMIKKAIKEEELKKEESKKVEQEKINFSVLKTNFKINKKRRVTLISA